MTLWSEISQQLRDIREFGWPHPGYVILPVPPPFFDKWHVAWGRFLRTIAQEPGFLALLKAVAGLVYIPPPVALESKIERTLDSRGVWNYDNEFYDSLLTLVRFWETSEISKMVVYYSFTMIYHVLEPGLGWHTWSCLKVFILNFEISEATPQNGLPLDVEMVETIPATESQVAASLGTPTGSKAESSPASPPTSDITSVSKSQDDVLWLSLVIFEFGWCHSASARWHNFVPLQYTGEQIWNFEMVEKHHHLEHLVSNSSQFNSIFVQFQRRYNRHNKHVIPKCSYQWA